MFLIHYIFIYLIAAQYTLFAIICYPPVVIYILIHSIFIYLLKLIIDSSHYYFYGIINKNKMIKNLLYKESQFNPFYKLYLKDKIKIFRNHHINKIVKIKTYTNKIFVGRLKYILPDIFIKINNNYYRSNLIKNITLDDMYQDFLNYKLLNIKENYPIYIPEEISEIIESFIFHEKDRDGNNSNYKSLSFSTTSQIISIYSLYGTRSNL